MKKLLLFLFGVSIASAHGGFGGGCCGGWWPFWGAGYFGGILGLVLLVGLIYLIFAVVRRDSHPVRHQSSALEILKIRYAKGEITKEEYERLKADLLEN